MFTLRNIQLLQVVIAILLMVAVLLQNRGSGLSNIFGGTGNVYRTKRGIEKKLFIATIVLVILFFLISLAGIIIYQA
ncbi:preprotein translocase subunit SecG [Candidatus Falkowbacteria bacterium CG_4_9_14_3_um_filter_38_19]|uniref:Protein-export membrane protein SecG n=1 Tax=Candidatus Falkowbacteria bacterium CG_4_9_14_3_um_filter_38_19 TaxID=1974559 RepID=A0A2M8AFR6_9BACT|nr:preprotein translocase subunit SecG [Candidatus Falkowbacteria bacterium]PJB16412.1 MAG: preprotein translocase subunit SecG [Candidatus Falkowbacteria bacterium CG_4_9_14_3_um_filter_38_19]